jgi:hypothetical protein
MARARFPQQSRAIATQEVSMKYKSTLAALLAVSALAFGAGAHAAPHYAPRGDMDHDGIQNRYDRDRDGDGIINSRDPNPNVPNVVHVKRVKRAHLYGPNGDLDRDGIRNRYDHDRDGDGIRNRNDRHPNHYSRTDWIRGHDRDHDGIRNRDDHDRDGDHVVNRLDRYPNNPHRS